MNTKKIFSTLALIATISMPILFSNQAQAGDRYYQNHDRHAYHDGYRDAYRHARKHERRHYKEERRHRRHARRHYESHYDRHHRHHRRHGRHANYRNHGYRSGIDLIFRF